MTCYSWEGLLKSLVIIGTFYLEGIVRGLIIFSCIVRLLWDCGIGFCHKLGWSDYRQVVFVIWRWSPSSVLWIQLEVGLFGGSRTSLCCRIYEEKVTLGFSRKLGGRTSRCRICFIPIFLFGLTVQKILNPTLWVLFNLVGSQFVHLMNGL